MSLGDFLYKIRLQSRNGSPGDIYLRLLPELQLIVTARLRLRYLPTGQARELCSFDINPRQGKNLGLPSSTGAGSWDWGFT